MNGNENIELKAADPDPAASERACRALGAVDGGLLVQRDTYFAVERGLLKLREDVSAGTAELIFYLRAHEDGARASSYWRAPASRSRRLARAARRGARHQRRRRQAPPALPAPQRPHPPRRRRGTRPLRRAGERAGGARPGVGRRGRSARRGDRGARARRPRDDRRRLPRALAGLSHTEPTSARELAPRRGLVGARHAARSRRPVRHRSGDGGRALRSWIGARGARPGAPPSVRRGRMTRPSSGSDPACTGPRAARRGTRTACR